MQPATRWMAIEKRLSVLKKRRIMSLYKSNAKRDPMGLFLVQSNKRGTYVGVLARKSA